MIMLMAILIIVLLLWVHLGWCWSEALMRLDAHTLHQGRNYRLSFIFWPISMMLWDAEQEEAGYDD